VFLAYFGTGEPDYYGIRATRLCRLHPYEPHREPAPLTGGVYCVSATLLQGLLLRTPGPWTREHERLYQGMCEVLGRAEQLGDDKTALDNLLREQTDSPSWEIFTHYFGQVRLARLCAYLRQREPDDQVGYSILIYRLSDANVEAALHGPPPFRR